MKYIDANKLKAEIERKYAEYKAKQKTDDFTYYEGMADALDVFEQFIDSLQQEQQEEPSESLEEAASNYITSYYASHHQEPDMTSLFIAGAEWQKSQMLKDAVEGRVFMSFAPGHNQMVMADVDLPTNTKVRIVVLKAEEE